MNEALEIPVASLPCRGERTLWHAHGRSIALFNVDGVVHAIDDKCPHAGASLFTGALNGRLIQCRAHGLAFDLATGCMRGVANFGVEAFRIEVRDGRHFLVPICETPQRC